MCWGREGESALPGTALTQLGVELARAALLSECPDASPFQDGLGVGSGGSGGRSSLIWCGGESARGSSVGFIKKVGICFDDKKSCYKRLSRSVSLFVSECVAEFCYKRLSRSVSLFVSLSVSLL